MVIEILHLVALIDLYIPVHISRHQPQLRAWNSLIERKSRRPLSDQLNCVSKDNKVMKET